MSSAIERVIATAKAEVGYLEKASNSQLDDKTTNVGNKNWTKYARDLDNLGNFYNGRKNGYSWCDVFVDWCFVKTFGAESAMSMLFQSKKSGGAGCDQSMSYYRNAGRFYSNPQPGDQIFFGTLADSTHTGLVYKVDSNRVYTIEGNTSSTSGVIANGGGVFEKSYPLTYTKIVGYGRPKYDVAPDGAGSDIPGGSSSSGSYQAPDTITEALDKIQLNTETLYIKPTLASFSIDSSYKNSRKYILSDVYNSFINTINMSATENIINLTSLEPNMTYLLKIVATGALYTAEKQVVFRTPQELPAKVSNLTATFGGGALLNRTCTLKFDAKKDIWGTYNYSNRKKGYRITLFLNGIPIATSDTLIKYSNTTTAISKTFNLSELSIDKNIKVNPGDSIQIGVQTWVKDDYDRLWLSDQGFVCSAPVYSVYDVKPIHKIYLKNSSVFNQTMLFMTNTT